VIEDVCFETRLPERPYSCQEYKFVHFVREPYNCVDHMEDQRFVQTVLVDSFFTLGFVDNKDFLTIVSEN